MKTICLVMTIVVSVFFAGVEPGLGETEWQVERTYPLAETPADAALSTGGRWVYVLTEGGKLTIFGWDGTFKDVIDVGAGVNAIKPGRTEEELFLINDSQKTVQLISLSFFHEINISGSPHKGAADAAVVIVVFDDFQ